jgi:hypothetical protein
MISKGDLDEIFRRLQTSPFRSRFRLDARDRAYLEEKGRDEVLAHALAFIAERLAPRHPKNDGQQTPMRGHPVFVAQHATATCCRGCLEKWHGIAAGQALSTSQQEFVSSLIAQWLDIEVRRPAPSAAVTKRKTPKTTPNDKACRSSGTRKKRGNDGQLDLFASHQSDAEEQS